MAILSLSVSGKSKLGTIKALYDLDEICLARSDWNALRGRPDSYYSIPTKIFLVVCGLDPNPTPIFYFLCYGAIHADIPVLLIPHAPNGWIIDRIGC